MLPGPIFLKTMTKNIFINTIADASIKYYDEYKILPSLTIAQAIKESNWGRSKLSALHHNYFGMKWREGCGCSYVEFMTKEYIKGTYISVKQKFRSYPTIQEGIKGYYEFLKYPRYANLKGVTDSAEACLLIQRDGWATAPNYGTSLFYDYVQKFNLLAYDHIVLPSPEYVRAGNVLHTVTKGDFLWLLAEKYYHNGACLGVIYKANNLDSCILTEGMKLLIP